MFASQRYLLGKSFRSFATKVTLKPLPYALNALEPVLSEELMDFHYNKHHQAYATNLNGLLEQKEKAVAEGDILKVTQLTKGIAFNGGGVYNHTFFWDSLAPTSEGGGEEPSSDSELRQAIESQWGSIDAFKDEFNAQTAVIQGSGWGWLCWNKNTKSLSYEQTAN